MGLELGGQVSMFIGTRSFAVQGGIRLRSQGGNQRLSFHLHSCHSQTNMAGGPPMDMVLWTNTQDALHVAGKLFCAAATQALSSPAQTCCSFSVHCLGKDTAPNKVIFRM